MNTATRIDPEESVNEYKRVPTGHLVPCPGEAHHNPHIDNCGLCAPLWGKIEERALVDLKDAQARHLDVSCGDLTEAQDAEMRLAERAGTCRLVEVKRTYGRGKKANVSYYFVWRWTQA